NVTVLVTNERHRPEPGRRVPVVRVIEEVSPVPGPGVVRDPARMLGCVAAVGEARALAEASRADRLGLRAEAAAHRVDPRAIKLFVGAAGRAADRPIDAVGNDL